jgi:membrane protein DedA with SNARE-associated domain
MTNLSLSAFLDQFGYYVVFLGALLEGETVVVLAGFAARRGSLVLQWVIALAAIGGFIGDQVFFWLGRHRKDWLFGRWPKMQAGMQKASAHISTYGPVAIVMARFVYGMRISSAVAFGISDIGSKTYLVFNLIGALIWATSISLLGYFFGAMAETLFTDIVHYEEYLLIAIIVFGGLLAIWHFLRNR